jgi:hypothetical protein
MPLEFGLWRVDDEPVRVATSKMALESKLEKLIATDPDILGRPMLLIGQQVKTDHGKVVDLLGMDAEGCLHVLELKRDRTPREVVAQVLDYGSWVQGLTNGQVREVYSAYARSRGLATELDEAFAERFGASPPDELNAAHTLTVVASEIDAATERIVTYLATGYQVPVNVVFFRYFEDEDRSYLARTWLMEETEMAASAATAKARGKQQPWNGTDWFVSFGDEPGGRSWEDGLRYGFVSAGGGKWYSDRIRSLPLQARVFTCIPKVGYVGIGTVSGEPQPFDDAVLVVGGEKQRMAGLRLQGTYRHDDGAGGDESEDRREWIVPIAWEKTVPPDQALWKRSFFANQNPACKLRSSYTIDEVSRHFGID